MRYGAVIYLSISICLSQLVFRGSCFALGIKQRDTTIRNALYKDGNEAWNKLLSDNLKYPQQARQAGIQGKVIAQFTIEEDGTLDKIKILQDPGGGMGDEVVRVLKLSGKWIPAMYKGKPTAVFFTIPITMKPTNAEDTVNAAAKWGPIDVGPGFPGGDAALKKFLRDNIRYPQEAKEKGICGRIYVQFVVEADGSLTDLKVMKDLGGGCGAEALRVFAKSPKWIPATYHGVAKRIQFIEPVDFVL